MYKKRILGIFLVILTVSVMGISMIPQAEARPKFILSGWSYPDSYGQGIESIQIYENSSGSFSEITESPVQYDSSQSEATLEWTAGVAIRLDVWTMLNCTLVGAASRTEGRNYNRHYVIVTDSSDNTVFSQQNFTYYYSNEDNYPLYTYVYRVTLDFLPETGEVYTVTIMYEIFY